MKLAVRCSGDGPDLVLLHGWGFDSRVWQPVCAPLERRMRLTLIDLPGYGRNRDFPVVDRKATIAALADVVPAGAVLGGWSMGGMLAIEFAAARAADLAGLLLIATTPSFLAREDWPHGVSPLLLKGFRAAVGAGAMALLQRFATLIHHGDRNARDLSRLFVRLLENLGDGSPPLDDALITGLDWLREVDLRSALPAIDLPALIVHGDHDPLMPLAGALELAECLPRSTVERFPDAAHAPFYSDPQRFADSVERFIGLPGAAC